MQTVNIPSNTAVSQMYANASGDDFLKEKVREICGRKPAFWQSKKERDEYRACYDAVQQATEWQSTVPPKGTQTTTPVPPTSSQPSTPTPAPAVEMSSSDAVKSIFSFLYKQSGTKKSIADWVKTDAGKQALSTAQLIVKQKSELKQPEAMKKILEVAYKQSGSTLSFSDWLETTEGTEAKDLAFGLTKAVTYKPSISEPQVEKTDWITPLAYIGGTALVIFGAIMIIRKIKGKTLVPKLV